MTTRTALLLLFLMLSVVSAVRAADPNEQDLQGAYIGMHDGRPLWVLIHDIKRTRHGCEFQFIRVNANSIQAGQGATTNDSRNISFGDKGSELKGVIQHEMVTRTILLGQTSTGKPVWRLRKVERTKAIHIDPEGDLLAATRLADDVIETLLAVCRKILPTTQMSGQLSIEIPKQLEAYIGARSIESRRPAPAPKADDCASEAAKLEREKRDREQELDEMRRQLQEEMERRQREESERKRLEVAARTGYYTVMPSGDLAKAGLISGHGLFRAVPRLKDLRLESFIKIDMEEKKELVLPYRSQRLEILTPHPLDSYQLIPISFEQTLLRVTDPEAFWRGRFLVIELH